MKKILKISLIAIIAILFIGTLIFLFMKSRPKKVIFETKTPSKTTIIKKSVATGSVIPRKEVNIKPKVNGIISEIYVLAGQKVKNGDMIAKIKIIPDMVQLNQAESRLKSASIAYNDTKIIFERQQKLFDEKVISEVEYRQALLNFDNVKNELNTAESNLQLIKEGITKSNSTETNTLVRSTIEGMVLDVPVKVGTTVIQANSFNDGTTIASVADMGEMIFQGKVDETEVGKLKQGMNLILTIGAIDKITFDANLEYVSPKGVTENGAIQFEIKAKVKLKSDSVFIRAGYSANADIVLDRRDSVIAVTENLLTFQNDSAFAEIEVKPQVYEKRYIKTGLSDGMNIEVLSGLKLTDKIKIPK